MLAVVFYEHWMDSANAILFKKHELCFVGFKLNLQIQQEPTKCGSKWK